MLEKLFYQIKTSLSIIRHYIKINIILTFSLAAGLLLPILCIGNINVFINSIPTIKINNADSSLILYGKGTISCIEEVVSYLKNKIPEILEIEIVARKSAIISWNGDGTKNIVYYASEKLLTFEKFRLLSGNMDIFQNDRNLCLVESAFINRYGNLKVGNSVLIAGKSYTIAGIFSSFNYYGRIIVPYSEKDKSGFQLSTIYLDISGVDNYEYIINQGTVGSGFTVTKILDGESAYRSTLQSGIKTSLFIMLIGLMSLGLAVINITLVLTGKLMQIKRVIGIRVALGATKASIIANVVIENFFFYLLAFSIDIIAVQILIPFFPKEVVFLMNTEVYLITFLLGFFVLFGVSLLSVNILYKRKLPALIERR